jgi:hypothetical protein
MKHLPPMFVAHVDWVTMLGLQKGLHGIYIPMCLPCIAPFGFHWRRCLSSPPHSHAQVTRAMLAELAQLAAANPSVRIGSMAAAAGVRLPTPSALASGPPRTPPSRGGGGGGGSRPSSARSQGSVRSSGLLAGRGEGSRPGSIVRQVQVGM